MYRFLKGEDYPVFQKDCVRPDLAFDKSSASGKKGDILREMRDEQILYEKKLRSLHEKLHRAAL